MLLGLSLLSGASKERQICSRRALFREWDGCKLYSDACLQGYGAWLQLADGKFFYVAGLWPLQFSSLIIADLELLAHIMAVTVLLPAANLQVAGLRGFVDNQNTLHWVNKLHCKHNTKEAVWDEAASLWRRENLIHRYALHLAALPMVVELDYIHTDDNFRADWLSRGKLTLFLDSCPMAQAPEACILVPPRWWSDWMPMLSP